MFQNDLRRRFERVFGIPKTTYDAPNPEAPEQDTLFIEILTVKSRMSAAAGGRETARVLGAVTVFSQAGRLPYGYFLKRIENAAPADKKNLFFEPEQDVPGSPARYVNLHERRLPFLFLYDSQYDPDKGEITEITFEE